MNIFFSQIVGFIAFVIYVISIQQKSKPKILCWQIGSFFLYSLQYLLIEAYSGMMMFSINMIRCIVFYICEKNIDKKQQKNKIVFIIFILISLLCGGITYNSIYDILPILASLSGVIFTWQPSTKILRYGQIETCVCWIIYDAFVMAYIGILTESVIIISTIYALLQHDYNFNVHKRILKIYLKLKFKASEEVLNFSPELPLIKWRLIKRLKGSKLL